MVLEWRPPLEASGRSPSPYSEQARGTRQLCSRFSTTPLTTLGLLSSRRPGAAVSSDRQGQRAASVPSPLRLPSA